ncbi:MAG: hypothetical protein UV38_C0003G0226 [candidate division TM6 bacterium GW2011_GWE2_42_60]|nr:MAG: hypothetical protein UV38_C0003G0226 [candidate division TM6 bacterium GW2011_GWE2_42_60]HBY05844.1 hypothetical protein [Candidatus Dependentiae bacterium]
MHYLEVVNSRSPSVAKQSQSFRSRFSTLVGRSFDKSKFFVRRHQTALALGALGLVSLGVVGYYSGLFSGSGDKTEKTKKEQVSFYKKGEDVTNQWKIKLAILYSLQTVTAFGSNVFTELARVFYKMTEPATATTTFKFTVPPEFESFSGPFLKALNAEPFDKAKMFNAMLSFGESATKKLSKEKPELKNYRDLIYGPLYYQALVNNKPEIAQSLSLTLSNGVNTVIGDEEKPLALHFAIANKDIQAVRALLEKGADPALVVNDSESPLEYAYSHQTTGEERDEIYELLLRWKKETELINRNAVLSVFQNWYYDPFVQSERLKIGKDKVSIFEWLVANSKDDYLETLLLDPQQQDNIQDAVEHDENILKKAFALKQKLTGEADKNQAVESVFDAIDKNSPWQIAWYLKAENIDPLTSIKAKYKGKEASRNVFEYYFIKKQETHFQKFYEKYGEKAQLDTIFPSIKDQLIDEWKERTSFDWLIFFWDLMSDSEKKELVSGANEHVKKVLSKHFESTSDSKYFTGSEIKQPVKKPELKIEQKLEKIEALLPEDKKLFEKNLDLCIQRIKDKVGVLPDEINALKNSFLDMKLVQQDKDLKKKVKTLLAGAIKYSARTLLEALIEKGVSKEKALCLAVENVESNLSAVAMVEYLLNKNADPNCKCSLWSPLVIISKKLKQAIIDQNNLKNYIEISQLLLKAGANYGEKYKLITLETINLKTPPLLYEWEFAGFENKEEWFKFIGVDEKYLDPDQNKSGIAFAGKYRYKSFEKALKQFLKIVNAGKKATQQELDMFSEINKRGLTQYDIVNIGQLIQKAFENQDYELLRLLLKKELVNENDLLKDAVKKNSVEFAKELITYGAKLNVVEKLVEDESDPENKKQYMKILVELMNPVDAIDNYYHSGKVSNQSFLTQDEFEKKFNQITKENALTLKTTDSKMPLLVNAVWNLDFDHIQKLLNKGVDFDVEVDGYTPLFEACKKQNIVLVKTLLQKTKNMPKTLNVAVKSSESETPLRVAAHNNDEDLVKLLLAAGANPNIGSVLYERVVHLKWLIEGKSDTQIVPGGKKFGGLVKATIKLLIEHGAEYGKKNYRKTYEDDAPYLSEWEVLGFPTKEAWFKDLGVDQKKLKPEQDKSVKK